jgi:hypothetical protein
VGIALIVLSSFTKDFKSINTNPNSPTAVPASNVLGHGIISLSNILFQTHMDLYYVGSYSGMSVSTVQGDYEYRVDINNGWWTGLYAAMNDFVDADSIASKDGNTNLQAVALTMKAYTAEATTYMFGDIPYSEAFEGTSKGIIYPKYDNQQDVYNALIAELKSASELFNKNEGDIGAGDFIFHGDVSKWRKFCNSIILRAAIRISNVDPVKAKTIISGILGSPSDYPIMTSNDDNAYLYYPGTAPDQDLWYEDPLVGNNALGWFRLNDVLVSTLKNNNDPRLQVYAVPNKYGIYNGYHFGSNQLSDTMNNSNNLSRIGDRFANDPKGFSPFMNSAEVYFMLAEVYERNLATGDAQESYENGITISMEENGISSSAIQQFLGQSGIAWNSGSTSNLEKIYLQKWVSLFKQNLEAWSEARRTDVPLMTNISQDYSQKHNRPPFRFPYPNVEKTLNTNFPKNVVETDIFWGTQMWWDTRTNVH